MSARQNCQKKSEIAQFSIKNGLNDPLWSIFGSDLRVIDLKYFENFYGALSLYFWAFEATLESEYVSSQNADFNLWNVLTQIFRQKLKNPPKKDSLSFYSKRKFFILTVFNFFHIPPYHIRGLVSLSDILVVIPYHSRGFVGEL